MNDDIIKGEFFCPKCGSKLKEKRPVNDKRIVKNKDKIVRFFCVCGYYRDGEVNSDDFIK
jgi:hypothetical protein